MQMNEEKYFELYEKVCEKISELPSESLRKYQTKLGDFNVQCDYLTDTGKITISELYDKYSIFASEMISEMEADIKADIKARGEAEAAAAEKANSFSSLFEKRMSGEERRAKEAQKEAEAKARREAEAVAKKAAEEAKIHLLKEAEAIKAAGKVKSGAIPKTRQEEPMLIGLNKRDKSIYTKLNKCKLSCVTCRKTIKRFLNETTRISTRVAAIEHLKSSHNIKIKILTPESLAPPIASDTELTWDESDQNTDFYRTVVTSQDLTIAQEQIGGHYPLIPPTTESTPSEMEVEKTSKTQDNENFIPAKNTTKRKASSPPEEIQTRNKYQLLTDTENEEEIQTIDMENEENIPERNQKAKATPRKTTGGQESNTKANLNQNRKNKTNSPPPIIMEWIYGKSRHDLLRQQLEETLSKGYSLKYAKKNVVIYAKDIEQYKQFKLILQQDRNVNWHTYATETERTHAFVAKGLDHEPDINDIKQELKETHNIEAVKIFPMKTKYRLLYLVITPAHITLKHMKNIKYLDHVETRWELRRKFSEMTQCKTCCGWGHSATFCNRTLKCPNCGESHEKEIEPCQRTSKCANCQGTHMATDLNCETYKFRVEKLKEQRDRNKKPTQRYVEAPRPKDNAWEARKKAFQQTRREEFSSEDESSEGEADATAGRRPPNPRQLRAQKRRTNEEPRFNEADTVSELLTISKDYKLLGNNLKEAVRFLGDFLQIFKMTNKEDRAFALLNIMIQLNNYDF